MKVQGRCHCGAITYEAEVEPGTVNVCHCLDCQMLTGSAFRANIAAPADRFRILTGKPRQYIKVADSGARRVHAFCEACGSPVYSCAPNKPADLFIASRRVERKRGAWPAGSTDLDKAPPVLDTET